MVIDRQIRGEGTTEDEWQATAAFRNVPSVHASDLVPSGQRVVICAPHPDDEILPCAGLLSMLREREIVIIAVTDGEASHPDRSEYLREVRPTETAEALRRMGVEASVIRFGLPDGGLSGLESELTERLLRQFTWRDVIFTPWRWDGHPDHEALTAAVLSAASQRGCAQPIEMPIWGWHWVRPETEAIPWERAVRVDLDAATWAAKRRSIEAFASQIEAPLNGSPILTSTTLERFDRPFEIFFR